MKMPALSVIIHTRNSAQTLDRALRSISAIASQIIVMDMESTDDSIKIAQSFHAEIYSTKHVGYVEQVRNKAIQKAKESWIFILDADEWIEKDLSEKISSLIQTAEQSVSAYAFPRQNHIFKQVAKSGWWPDYQIRLFRNGSVVWGSKIHSKPQVSGITQHLPDNERFAIQHDNYSTVYEFIDRLNRYTTIEIDEHKSEHSPLTSFVNEFIRRFIVMEGYTQGNYGQSLAVLQGVYEAVKAIKTIEKKGFSTKMASPNELQEISNIFSYWSKTLMMQRSRSVTGRWYWKLRRKLCL